MRESQSTRLPPCTHIVLSPSAQALIHPTTGRLVLVQAEKALELDATESWHLLEWLNDFQRDRLYQIVSEAGEQALGEVQVPCEGCGYEFKPDEMQGVPVLVNLRDGTQRSVSFCGVVCVDFWEETAPGEWVPLHSGEEVQRVNFRCDICESVVEYKMIQRLIDTYDFDPDDPLGGFPEAEYLVCSSCRKREKERFKTKEEIGL